MKSYGLKKSHLVSQKIHINQQVKRKFFEQKPTLETRTATIGQRGFDGQIAPAEEGVFVEHATHRGRSGARPGRRHLAERRHRTARSGTTATSRLAHWRLPLLLQAGSGRQKKHDPFGALLTHRARRLSHARAGTRLGTNSLSPSAARQQRATPPCSESTSMTSIRKRKSHVTRFVLNRHLIAAAWEDRLWDRMPAIGREFGSRDFDRLMAEDHRRV